MTIRSTPPRGPIDGTSASLGFFERGFSADVSKERAVEWTAFVLAGVLHVSGVATAATSLFELAGFADQVRNEVLVRLGASIEIDPVEKVPEPEPEPEPAEQPEQEPNEELPRAPLDPSVEPSEDAPPPAAAEAGQVMTAEPDPNEPLDLTGDGFISGTGTRFAGGVTAATGTSTKAVRNLDARATGTSGSQGKTDGAAGPPPVDRSRPAGLPLGANWKACGFPPEADAEQINQALVRVVVVVGENGKPTSVNVLSDPGYGFGGWARRCAMRFQYPVGLDKKGNPTARATPPFLIHFTR